MIEFNNIKSVYLLGIGGIGMSALARYFRHKELPVGGYDRVQTPLTRALEAEGMEIHFEDNPKLIGTIFRDPTHTLVIYTPAIPSTHSEWSWFRENGFHVQKRAEVLGILSRAKKTIAISGTHGKTSITTMIAHLFVSSNIPTDAFMGGIAKNYGTNMLFQPGSSYLIAEADEYDRSFLQLSPYFGIITATDPDHLDIFGTHNNVIESFREFSEKITPGGYLLVKQGVPVSAPKGVHFISYSLNEPADYYATQYTLENGLCVLDLKTPSGTIEKISVGVPGRVNAENAVAAMAAALTLGCPPDKVREGMGSFRGVERRFDIQFESEQWLYIDDYGHHPEELRYTIQSVREIYPNRFVTGIFQPHLYSRTQSLYLEFAKSLDLLDRVVLMDIYPAREQPIEGVSSQLILDHVTIQNKELCTRETIVQSLRKSPPGIVITMGAGNIDQQVPIVTEWLRSLDKNK